MDTKKFVKHRGGERKNGKLSSDESRLVPGPVDLRLAELITVLKIIACDAGDVTLSPTPQIVEGRIDSPKADCDADDKDQPDCTALYCSALDKGPE